MVGTQLEGTMNESTVQELRAKLRGELITPTDLTYETARKVYNAMIDRRLSKLGCESEWNHPGVW